MMTPTYLSVMRAYATKLILIASAALLLLTAVLVQTARAEMATYKLDPAHVAVVFLVHHIGFADTVGRFNKIEGSFDFDEDRRALGAGEIVIDTASVDTGHEARDNHLRGTDFFNVAEHPQMTFSFEGGEALSERTGKVTGTLSLLGVERPVSLDVTWNKSGRYPFGPKSYVVGISARGTVKRSEFGMMYAVENEWVGDDIALIIEIEAIRQDG